MRVIMLRSSANLTTCTCKTTAVSEGAASIGMTGHLFGKVASVYAHAICAVLRLLISDPHALNVYSVITFPVCQ